MPGPAPQTVGVALPPGGREGDAPACPYALGDAGAAWWVWAWRTPQATQWDVGSHYVVARRAQLEDSLAALDAFDPGALEEFFEGLHIGGDPERLRDALADLGDVIGRLQALAGARLAVLREMRELDDRFGLDPRAMVALKWTISSGDQEKGDGVDSILKGRHLRVADKPA